MMAIQLDLKEIEEGILAPLNEILQISYGTEVYRQILLSLEQIVRDLEKQHSKNVFWQ